MKSDAEYFKEVNWFMFPEQVLKISDFQIVKGKIIDAQTKEVTKYACFACFLNEESLSIHAFNLDMALLICMEHKYLGHEEGFAHFASKMLGGM